MRFKRLSLSILISCISIIYIYSKGNSTAINPSLYKRTYITNRLVGGQPVIDGKFDDECWNQGEWSEDFVQHLPIEGNEASQRTTLKVLYDDHNIFVAIRCYDKEPSKIQNYTGKRDEMLGDMVGVNFDSYFDHRTGYEFNVTAGGSKIDLLLKNNGEPDFNWDAVWYVKTAMEDSAWTAEFQIPLSQLRYNNKPEQTWGMHSWRWINRLQEEDQWSLIPRNNNGFIYSFGELHGIKDIPRSRRIEFLPYTLGKLQKSPVEKGNPFSKKYATGATVGIDGKVGIGSDFTLDYTINPDFGQVEADPSVMNLSTFETFYSEKRPFFLEGKNVLDYSLDGDMLFYSRRVGHSPSKIPDSDNSNNKFVDVSANTAILNAVKFTGKTADGLSVGVLQSFTNEEYAEVDDAGKRKSILAEPYTNYLLGRVQKDYNAGNTIIGGIVTATNRNINDSNLFSLVKNAYSGGLDVMHYWNDRNYYISVKTIGSHIDGKKEALLETQQSAVHYYQRPDAKYLGIDSAMTTLNGYGGNIAFGREGKNKLRFEEKVAFRSPGLEMNDLGFLMMADYIRQTLNIKYKETVPGKVFREYQVNFENVNEWSFGGVNQQNTSMASIWGQFHNKWGAAFWIYRQHSGIESRELRGGPSLKASPFWHFGGEMNTDWSKKISFNCSYSTSYAAESNSNDMQTGVGVGLRFSSRFNLNTNMFFGQNNYDLMYIDTKNFNGKDYYIMGRMNQNTLSFTVRANYNITTNLSIQYYGSPFISSGKYKNLKQISDPLATKYKNRFIPLETNNLQYNEGADTYSYNNGSISYTFDNTDFTMREFRSNLVARWEYKEGSVLYLVWSHQRADSDTPYTPSLSTSYNQLFDKAPDNIFMLKFNYYFAL